MLTLHMMMERGTSLWGLAGGGLALLALPAYRLAAWRWRTQRLLAIQLRLEAAWQNTRAALIAIQISRSQVLSEPRRVPTSQTVQQRQFSCDI